MKKFAYILAYLTLWGGGDGLYAQINFKWAKDYRGANAGVEENYVALDAVGNVYTAGRFGGKFDFDPGPDSFFLTSAGLSDVFICKLDSSGDFVWAKRFGSVNRDYCYSIDIDAAGNVYTIGSFNGTVDFDPGAGTYNLTSTIGEDVYISKLDNAGNFVWAKHLEGGSTWDGGYSIHIDAGGNVYTTGAFGGTVDFNPGSATYNMTSAGSHDIFILKLDASGNFIWAKQLGGKGMETGYAIMTDVSRKLYITGYYSDTADFDPGSGLYNLISTGGKDIFVSKLDTAGNFLWAKSMGGSGDDMASAMVIDPTNFVYTTGQFMYTADFEPSAASFYMNGQGFGDIFISKLDTAGNFVWARALSGGNWEYTKSIALDTAGNIYTTGFFGSATDFDPGTGSFQLSSAGFSDFFISKLDRLGNFVWAYSAGNTNQDYGYGIALSLSGNIYTSGNFINTVDFDPTAGVFNMSSMGNAAHGFVSKLSNCVTAPVIITPSKNTNICPKDTVVLTASPAASYLWSTGATTRSIKVSTTDTFKVTATNSTGCPAYNYITVKVHQDTTIVDKYICQGSSFLFNGTQLTSAGVYRDTLPNFVGCDSLVILNLYIKNVDTTHVYDTLCGNMPVTFNNQSLTAAGLYRDTIKKLNGCDSHIFYHFIPKPSYIMPITRAICASDSSFFGGIYLKTAGVYTDTLKTMRNCDSVIQLTLIVRTVDTSIVYDTLCSNMPKTFNAQNLTLAGIYRDTLKNIAGCDSHIFYHFIPKPVYETPISRAVCAGDSSLFDGVYRKAAGTYYDTLKTMKGCDSVIKMTLTINTLDTNKQTQTICRGKSYNFYSQILTLAGNYSHKLKNKNNCDSLIVLTLSVIDSTSFSFSRLLCKGQSFVFNNQTLTQAGVYRDTFMNYLGCDSFVTLNLSFGLVLYDTLRQTVCAGQIFRGYSSPGTYSETLKSSQGCDSILTIYLRHLPATEFKTISHNKCGAFLYSSRTYTQNDSFTETIKNYLNCDSIVTKHFVYITNPNPKFLADKTIEFCEEIIHKGQLKTASFFTQDTIKSLEFPYCDSIYQPYYYRRENRPVLTAISKQIDTVIKGETTNIKVSGAQNYRWTSGEQSSAIRPQINEDKTFEVTAWNLADCEEKMQFSIYAIDQPLIDFPTAFSPNGDGLNDYFTPNLSGNISIDYFQIFNRWGEKVYEHNPSSKGWDGSYQGIPAANGVYSYMLRYSYLGRYFTKTGEVMMVR